MGVQGSGGERGPQARGRHGRRHVVALGLAAAMAMAAGGAAAQAGAGAAAAAGAHGAPPDVAAPVLVELFTSQGCEACPPADALLADLAVRSDVVALALHVDYWDYIGWADPHARAENSQRQKAYARAAGAKAIYTPQMVIDGRVLLPGNRRAEVLAAIVRAREGARRIRIDLLPDAADGTRRVGLRALQPIDIAGVVQLVRFRPETSILIEAGENQGRLAVSRNVVTDWAVVTEWSGQGPVEISLPSAWDGPVAVIVQESGQGAVLASAAFR